MASYFSNDSAIIAVVITGGVALLGIIASSFTSMWVNEKKITADILLAEKKFNSDRELSKQKFEFEKAQAIHKRRFELAETLLADAYKFRESVGHVRHPFSRGGEGGSRPGHIGEDLNTKNNKDSLYVPIERLNKEDEFISVFFARQYATQAHFGSEATTAFNLFFQAIVKIRTSSEMLILTAEQPNKDEKISEANRADIWSGMAKAYGIEDVVENQIADGVAIIEKLCKPALEWKGA